MLDNFILTPRNQWTSISFWVLMLARQAEVCQRRLRKERGILSVREVFSCFQIKTVDWPFEEGGNGANERSILDYVAQNKFDMVINLPLRTSGSRRASSYITHGYRTRRMAIDFSIPLITDIKCAKLFIEVIVITVGLSAEWTTSAFTFYFANSDLLILRKFFSSVFRNLRARVHAQKTLLIQVSPHTKFLLFTTACKRG